MNEREVRRRPGGRSARVRQAVLDATLDALVEHGVDKLTVGDVAERAGVHETSIYRRWGSREHLIIDALLTAGRRQLPVPDTGTVRGDLATFAKSLVAYLGTPLGKALAQAIAVAADDPALAESRAEFWRSRLDLARAMIDRAVDRGELPTGTDPHTALELLISPLHFRALFTREPVDDAFADRLVDLVLHALTP